MNTPEGENAPLLRAPPRRPSYAAPSSVRNGVAATLVAGCVVATLAVSGRLGREPARVERAATAVSSTEAPREAKMGVAPGVVPAETPLGNFFTDAWDSTVGELVPSMSFAEPAPAPEGPPDADAEGDPSREAEAPGSDFYPGVIGCEATCESDDVATQEDCDAIGPFCEWGEGKCWSAVGPDPCPTDWGEAEGAEAPGPGADAADAPSPPEKKTKKEKKKEEKEEKEKTKKDDADAPAPAYDDADDDADAPAPAYDDAEAPAPAAEIDLLGELETVYGDDKTDDDAKKREEKFDALDDELNRTRRHTKDSEDDLSPAQKLKRIKKAIERGPSQKKASKTSKTSETKTSKTSTKTSKTSDAHPTGSITPPKIPALFEAEVFRGDLAEGVSDDVLAQIVRTKMADNKYEGLFEDLEVKRFEFRVTFDVTVAGSRCPEVSDDAFADGVKAFVKRARADDAIARFGEDERTPLQKVTERNREPTRAPKREVHDDLDGVLRSMAVGACENVARAEDVPAAADSDSDSAEKEEKALPKPLPKSAKPTESSSSSSELNAAHKFRVDLVIPRAGPETNAAEMTDRVGGLFDVAHVKKQLEAAHVSKAREDATDVSIDDVTVHGKISVAEKTKR